MLMWWMWNTARLSSSLGYNVNVYIFTFNFGLLSFQLQKMWQYSLSFTNGWDEHIFHVGLDWYRAGARYPILSAAAMSIPIPIPEMTHSMGHTYITYAAHTIRMFQNITSLCFETYIQYAYAVSSWWHYQKKNS